MKVPSSSPRNVVYLSLAVSVICILLAFTTGPKASAQKAERDQLLGTEPQEPQSRSGRDEQVTQVLEGDSAEIKAATNSAGQLAVLVELSDAPAATVYADKIEGSKLPRDVSVAQATEAAQTQLARITRAQDRLAAILSSSSINATEIYRVQRVLNGIAVYVAPEKLAALRQLPGVKAVHLLVLEYPSLSTSVPFIGAPELWNNAAGVRTNVTGAGIKVGIIDTGIDYQHSNFGGRGLLADYTANNRTSNADGFFPTQKVAGGYDFAGDAYTGGNAPAPDPDPMDCNGHGTHVAGIAAGQGVNADGTTFTGPYSPSTPFLSLRVGPGVAPRSSLYAIRVFGCTGGTNLTVPGIEWSIDPNSDGDFEDRMDVINMSLGSNFGVASNPSALASDNAVRAGVVVVASSGNAGDTFFISGAPGVSGRAISVANTLDPGVGVNRSRINAPPAITRDLPVSNSLYGPQLFDVTGDVVLGLDVAEPLDALPAGTTTDGCSPLSNAAAAVGKIVLVDRGRCAFELKSKNAQDAGAIGVMIANNAAGLPPNFSDDPTITSSNTVPTVGISQADGNAIKAQLAVPTTVNVTLRRVPGQDTLSASSSRGPRGGGTSAIFALKPDIAAPGTSITSAQTGVSCPGCITPTAAPGFVPNNQALTISGTSMAAPHVAGAMALLRELNPTWTVEELKAQVMNGAIRDIFTDVSGTGTRFGPGQVGAGRLDVPSAAKTHVVAYNADDAGLVSVSFANEVVEGATRIKTVRVVNKGITDLAYDLAIDTLSNAPGVTFSLPGGNTITAPAGKTVTFQVRMDAVEDQMDHTRDPSVPATQTGASPFNTVFANFPRHYLTEEGAYVTFKIGSDLKLRVPVYSPARPASTMSASDTIPAGATTIALTGNDVCTGALAAGPTCTGSFPVDVVSLVSGFELQVVSPRDTSIPGETDIRNVGVGYDATTNRIRFGVASYEEWSTPNDVAYSIFIDADENGTYERVLVNTSPGAIARRNFGNANASGQDIFISLVFTPPSTVTFNSSWLVNAVNAAQFDTVVFNNNVMFLSVDPAAIGLTAGNSNFRYKVETCPGFAPLCSSLEGFSPNDRAAGPYTWDYLNPGLDFGTQVLVQDLNGKAMPVTANLTNLTNNGSLGALLLHHHNTRGTRAESVGVQGLAAPLADLGLALTVDNASPTAGSTVTFTLSVTNNGPAAATNVKVTSNEFPIGLTYLSDNSGGFFNPATRTWAAGNLASGQTATLKVVAAVTSGESPGTITARISSYEQVDVNPANDQATVIINAANQADLRLALEADTLTSVSGSQVAYTLVLTNNGEDTAHDIVVNGVFTPSSVTFISAAVTQGVFDPATGTWRIASLGKGVSARLTYRVTTPSGVCNQFSSSATVTSATFDPVPSNNSVTATTRINDTPCVALSAATYTVNEGAGRIDITVTRTGTATAPATVNYTTTDGTATQKGDYIVTLGTLDFAAGELSKTVSIFITDDTLVEGDETFLFTLSDPSSGTLGATPNSAVITITDNDAVVAPNPIDNVDFFVRQHYRDFLNRDPDAAGLAFWTGVLNNNLANCSGLPGTQLSQCRTFAYARVSEAFFLSIEFQDTGFLVYRFYKASFPETVARPRALPRYLEFMRDTQEISDGIVVGSPGWEAALAANQLAFAQEFVQRAEFTARYPTTQTPAQFVDALYATAAITPSTAERQAAIDEFGGAPTSADTTARARVLRRVADNAQFKQREFNPAFVLMEYFGYLRRSPDEAPDSNFDGYDFWLNKLNSFADFRQAQMVEAFILSAEYRSRFGLN
ncbi:MAG: S8 family serine peptidase [Pyrinomonadaceae bacterium]